PLFVVAAGVPACRGAVASRPAERQSPPETSPARTSSRSTCSFPGLPAIAVAKAVRMIYRSSRLKHFTKKENREGHHPLCPFHPRKSSARAAVRTISGESEKSIPIQPHSVAHSVAQRAGLAYSVTKE